MLLVIYQREVAVQPGSRCSASLRGQFSDSCFALFVGHARVLEIGIGDGRGTLALLAGGASVISIDENSACLSLARDRIEAAGYPVTLLRRETLTPYQEGYEVKYGALDTQFPSSGALLVESDAINDEVLWDWLQSMEHLDAVVCWLLGSHTMRASNLVFSQVPVKITNAFEQRLFVQNMMYVLAEHILRPGGVLDIVDRGEPLDDEAILQDLLRSHRDQAQPTTLTVERADWRLYQEGGAGGIPVGVSVVPKSGRTPDMNRMALVSVIAQK